MTVWICVDCGDGRCEDCVTPRCDHDCPLNDTDPDRPHRLKELAMTPVDQHAHASAEVDTLSVVITRGAPISPDLTLRMVTATRDRLNRHRPVAGRCNYDGLTYPCPDVAADLKVFGPGDDDEQ
ncbi:hypothetical protein ACFWC6_30840 [Micromonospora chalcea]